MSHTPNSKLQQLFNPTFEAAQERGVIVIVTTPTQAVRHDIGKSTKLRRNINTGYDF